MIFFCLSFFSFLFPIPRKLPHLFAPSCSLTPNTTPQHREYLLCTTHHPHQSMSDSKNNSIIRAVKMSIAANLRFISEPCTAERCLQLETKRPVETRVRIEVQNQWGMFIKKSCGGIKKSHPMVLKLKPVGGIDQTGGGMFLNQTRGGR